MTGFPLEWGIGARCQKTRMLGLPEGKRGLAVFDTIQACDRQTPSHSASHVAVAKTALTYTSVGKKWMSTDLSSCSHAV